MRSRAGRFLAAIALLLTIAGTAARCRRGEKAEGKPEPLRGDAVWLTDGPQEGDTAALEDALERFACSAVFFPARRVVAAGEGRAGEDLPAPSAPFTRVPVILVLGAAADPLAGGDEDRTKRFGDLLAREISATLARRSQFGSVRGVHLDLPYSAATVARHAEALARARNALAHELSRAAGPDTAFAAVPVTYSIRQPPPPDEKGLAAERALASRADGFVAFLFSEGGHADPAHTDSLGKPWWAAYSPAGRVRLRRAGGAEESATLPEAAIDELSDDSRAELRHELPWTVDGGAGFAFRARRPVSIGSASLGRGDSAVFFQPSLADFLAHFAEDTAKRPRATGRVVVFSGPRDADRMFPIAALEEVVAGKRPVPRLGIWTASEGGRLVRVGADNSSPHASLVSRVENWVEVDLAPAHVADVEPGGFDRWEAYDAAGRPVSPGRATRIRLFETFVAPAERLEPARLRVRGSLPSPCCRTRSRTAAAAGGEAVTDWQIPGRDPTPGP